MIAADIMTSEIHPGFSHDSFRMTKLSKLVSTTFSVPSFQDELNRNPHQHCWMSNCAIFLNIHDLQWSREHSRKGHAGSASMCDQ